MLCNFKVKYFTVDCIFTLGNIGGKGGGTYQRDGLPTLFCLISAGHTNSQYLTLFN